MSKYAKTVPLGVVVTFPVTVKFSSDDIKNLKEDGETFTDEAERISEELDMHINEAIENAMQQFDPTWFADVEHVSYRDIMVSVEPLKPKPKKVAKRR